MTDQTMILLVVLGFAVVIGLFIANNRAKHRFEDERAERKRELERIKAEARARDAKANDGDSAT